MFSISRHRLIQGAQVVVKGHQTAGVRPYFAEKPIASNYEGSIIPYPDDYSTDKIQMRRQWVEQYTGSSLRNVGQLWKGDNQHSQEMFKDNTEMPIGLAKVPMSVVGPLQINGSFAQGKFLAPLAITEGAVTASTNRGAAALNKCGGVRAFTSQLRTSWSPVFEAATPEDALALGEWVKDQKSKIQQEVVSECFSEVTLKEISSFYDLQYVHFVLNFDTGDQTQQDVIKSLSSTIAKWIVNKAPDNIALQRYWNDSRLSGLNKCSRLNMLHGQGLSCGAEAILTEEVLRKNLGASSEGLLKLWQNTERWSDRSLSMGCNVNIANIIGAIFAATGQDLSNTVDSGAGRTQFVIHDGPGGGLKHNLWIPSLVIRTEDHGSELPTQKQSLEMMDCYGPNKIRKLAEIIASFCIALDISTVSAVVAGEFTTAHEKLGKNRPT